jgi:hypothetical protein
MHIAERGCDLDALIKRRQIWEQKTIGCIVTDDEKAEWMEVGTSKSPPRTFMGGALEHVSNDLPEIFGRTVVTALKRGD